MTVQELIDELDGWDTSMEVYVAVEDDDGESLDAPLTSAYVQLGRVFLSSASE